MEIWDGSFCENSAVLKSCENLKRHFTTMHKKIAANTITTVVSVPSLSTHRRASWTLSICF
jgi:hypothetical protein